MKKLTALVALFVLLLTFPTAAVATNGQSGSFAAASLQYGTITNDLGINAANAPITIEMWVRLASSPSAGNDYTFATQQDAGTFVRYFFRYRNTAGVFSLYANRLKENTSNNEITTNFTMTVGTWYHVALTYDGTNMKLFSAVVAGTHTQQGSNLATSGNGASGVLNDQFLVANNYTGTATVLDGLIDEVRVWNTARSAATMDADFQQELVGNETNLKAYYRMEGNLNDTTSNAFHLTNTNSVTFSSTVPFSGAAAASTINDEGSWFDLF